MTRCFDCLQRIEGTVVLARVEAPNGNEIEVPTHGPQGCPPDA